MTRFFLTSLNWRPVAWLLLALTLSFGLSAGQPPHNPKIETALELAAWQLEYAPGQPLSLAGVDVRDGLVKVILEAESPGSIPVGRIQALGGRVEDQFARLVKVWLPFNRLEEVATLAGVSFIRRPHIPVSLGEPGQQVVSEGTILLGGVVFHSRDVLGEGVKIAIIDVGFSSLSYAKAAGELPIEVLAWARDYTGEGLESGGAHGTMVAEIVHDMAPKAKLYLARIGDEVDLGQAVEDCIRKGVDIIVHSVGWVNTNFGDGTGVIADIAKRATAAGILWVNAAGNHACRHWVGPVWDEDGDGWVEFNPGLESLELTVNTPGQVRLALTWDDWPHASADLDLFLFDRQGRVLATSQNRQTGWEPPTEDISCWVDPGRYQVRVRIVHAYRRLELELFSLDHDLTPHVSEKSIMAPGNVEQVVTVGAIYWQNWGTGPQETFSSQGPTNDGRLKPDVMGPDGVCTFLSPSFFGTSAAAPHVAGAAALLLAQARRVGSDLNPGALRGFLTKNAVDMGPPGPDPTYGVGRTQLIFEHAWAERKVITPILGDRVVQGDEFLVEVLVRMPVTQLGGLVLQEQLPAGLQATPLTGDGASVVVTDDGQTLTWHWPILDPGETRTITYKVSVDPDQDIGRYNINGKVNGEPVTGVGSIEVIKPLPVAEAVSRWRVDLGRIDPELDDFIDRAQLEAALDWWAEEELVPAARKRIDLGTMLRLVGCCLAGCPINTVPPHSSSAELAEVSYQFDQRSIWPGGYIEVTVGVEVKERILGMALELWVPPGWEMSVVDCGGAKFKGGAYWGQWLWPEELSPGTLKKIHVGLYAPGDALVGEKVLLEGKVTSQWPRFEQVIASPAIKVVNGEGVGFVIKGVSCTPNPIRQNKAVFRVTGEGIQDIRVVVYDLSGRVVFDSGWQPGPAFQWNLQDNDGRVVPNGVYLYWIEVRGAGGQVEQSQVDKLVVLR